MNEYKDELVEELFEEITSEIESEKEWEKYKAGESDVKITIPTYAEVKEELQKAISEKK